MLLLLFSSLRCHCIDTSDINTAAVDIDCCNVVAMHMQDYLQCDVVRMTSVVAFAVAGAVVVISLVAAVFWLSFQCDCF